MELLTTGREIYPGYQVLAWHNPQETFDLGVGSRLRLVYIEQGTGILHFPQRREAFIAPALFCLNETDAPHLEQTIAVKAQALYLHPSTVNSALDFENVRSRPSTFSTTEQQDSSMLRAFIHRDANYAGHLRLDPVSARRLAGLFEAIGQELGEQRDWFWPCRSRSFILELLFITDHVFDRSFTLVMPPPAEHSGDELGPVIVFLHAHYQEKITVDTLTRQFHTNRTTLTERFREATGVPVMTYLTQLRISLAASMLHDTTLPIFEVATRVGFNDLTNFGRAFRKIMGCPPSEYRERYCWLTG
jgi:AraC family L-rhamnose operon regulatory protein RhaS